MQHCTVCGSELPDDARFCGKCGHVISSIDTIDTIDQQPTKTLDEASSATNRDDPFAEEGLAQDDLAVIDTHLLTPYGSNGHKPIEASSTSGATVEPVVSENSQDSEAPEELSAHIHGLPEESPQVQSEEMLPVVPTKILTADPVPPVVSPPIAHTPAPNARRGSAKRWFFIALVILLIAGGIAGALVFLLHLPLPGIGGTPGAVTSPTSSTSTNVTPVNTVCPAGSTSCTTPSSTPTASGTASTSTVNMTFSGAVTGDMTVTNVARCGPSSSGSEYDIFASGTVGGTPYTFVSRITSYTGPTTYNTGHIFVVFSQQPLSPSTVWGNSGNLPARATINSDTKSGNMEIDLSGSVNTVHVSGSWNCA